MYQNVTPRRRGAQHLTCALLVNNELL